MVIPTSTTLKATLNRKSLKAIIINYEFGMSNYEFHFY